ncbi:hypothetical protein FJZ31_06405 [Candidatus Poribacteria bacterium]|nr:hypothetical protein [Candidatus Poribacteria bacterium]
MNKREFDETCAWMLWKAVEKTEPPTKHPCQTAECLSFFQFEQRQYTFAQLLHLASCSYCQKTDWMFHYTLPTFKFLAIVCPAKRIIQQIGNTLKEVYPRQSREQLIQIPDALLQQEKSLLKKKTNVRYLTRPTHSTKNMKFLQLPPHLFFSEGLMVFPEVVLQHNQFDVILELRKCEACQVGRVIPNCYVTFQKAQKQVADTQTSEYGICEVYGLSAGTYQVTFDQYPHVNLELELLKENKTKIIILPCH